MRLAVLADIQGNLPALEAVLADMAGRAIDRVVDLGDCVSGPLWPRETLDRLMRLGWPTVRGNHDRQVGLDAPERLSRTDAFAASELDDRQRRYLAALPTTLHPVPGILAFHGLPEDDTAYLIEEVVDGRLLPSRQGAIVRRLGAVEAGLVLCAHSHLPASLRLPDGRAIVNPGSIGCPAYDDPTHPAHVSESGSPAARYAIIDGIGEAAAPGALTVALLSIPYDHQAASRRAAELGRPDWAAMLATGYAGTG